MLNVNYVLKDKNYLAIILFIFIMLSFQNWHFSSLANQNQELINLNKEVLSNYKDLIDNNLKHSESVRNMKIIAGHLEKQSGEFIGSTEKLSNPFFGHMN